MTSDNPASDQEGTRLKLGVFGRSRKENELRLPVHPAHFERIDPELRGSIYLEQGYGSHFGASDAGLEELVAGTRSQEELIEECNVILLPKPVHEDVERFRDGQVLWGWPHLVQDFELTQMAIDKKLTIIAWESMNHWQHDGSFGVHVFHKNNELAGYCSVLHAMQLQGTTGAYGPHLKATVISFGATGRGAVTALNAMGVLDVTVLTHRDPAAVESPIPSMELIHFSRDDQDESRVLVHLEDGVTKLADFLSGQDLVVNCVLQDTDRPYMFLTRDELDALEPGSLIIDVSCDEGMGFEWARPTSFEDPMFEVENQVHYYAVDHSPSYLWNSSTWEISEALLPYLGTVINGPEAWGNDETIDKAIEIREGRVRNPKILSFQKRAETHPYEPT
ncbi:MAG: N(5)-(carboxyethyl)ornithine synthase [Actinomycetota bacterium]|nr:N(5)-(carboxyethyl)ornithine synthase [Actinomycetota bacterium]